MRNNVHHKGSVSSLSYPSKREGKLDVSFTYDRDGNRKYLTVRERRKFLKAAKRAEPPVYAFCLVLTLTGARLSEVLALTPRQIDAEAGVITIRSLKKRRDSSAVFRAVPVPPQLLHRLEAVHDIKSARQDDARTDAQIWPWCRTTAWKRVKEVMRAAGIVGVQASPKGLRHGYAIGALVFGVPDTTVMRWLGHSRLETTMIYTEAIGAEAHAIAKRMWEPLLKRDLIA